MAKPKQPERSPTPEPGDTVFAAGDTDARGTPDPVAFIPSRDQVQAILTDLNNRLIAERGNIHRLRELLFGDGFKVD